MGNSWYTEFLGQLSSNPRVLGGWGVLDLAQGCSMVGVLPSSLGGFVGFGVCLVFSLTDRGQLLFRLRCMTRVAGVFVSFVTHIINNIRM